MHSRKADVVIRRAGGQPLRSMSKQTQNISLPRMLALLCVCLLGHLSASFAEVPAPMRVVIVGGGLAGLTAAYELQKRGIVAQVIEASDVFGGRVATARYPGGMRAEYGLQEIWEDNPALGIARELGVALDEESGEPFSSVIIDGKLNAFVQDTAAEYFATFLSNEEHTALKAWMSKASALRKAALTKGLADGRVRALQDLSFAEWIAGIDRRGAGRDLRDPRRERPQCEDRRLLAAHPWPCRAPTAHEAAR